MKVTRDVVEKIAELAQLQIPDGELAAVSEKMSRVLDLVEEMQSADTAGIEPMVRVVAVKNEAWSLPLLRDKGTITQGDIEIRWAEGQNSALDSGLIAEGRDVGNIVVQRRKGDTLEDVIHDVTFAFVFHAFRPDGVIHK